VADAGDPGRAEQIARSITDLHQQAEALVKVAEVVGLPHGCRLLGEAFAVGSWLAPLLVLAKLRPRLVIQIADEVYGNDSSCET
jgi:hypothetical protein